jgi:hypothetical protein
MAKPKPERDYELVVYEGKPPVHHFPGDFTFEEDPVSGGLMVFNNNGKIIALFKKNNWAAVVKLEKER